MSNTAGTGPAPPSPQPPLTTDELVTHYVELWNKTVDVQQHFNDLEWRIRGLALTAATFALGAAGLAAKDGPTYKGFSLGAMILLVGIILWYGFYFADKYWYHALLIGSVKHGSALEEELRKYLPEAGLTDAISEASPQKPSALEFWLPRDKTTGKMRSTNKLNAFYAIGAVALGITAVALEIISFIPKPSPPKVDRVIEVIKPTPTTGPDSNSSTTTAPTTATITTIAPPPPPPSIPSSPTPAPGPGTPTPNQTGS